MSAIFYKQKPIIGFDISKTSIKVMSVDTAKMLVHGYGAIDLDPSKISDDMNDATITYLSEKTAELFTKKTAGMLSSQRAVIGIPTARTFFRTFTLPSSQAANVKEAVNLESEQYIPIALDSLYLDYQITDRTKEQITVAMCAAPRKMIDGILEVARRCGIDAAMIEPSMNAVARLLKRTEEGALPTIVIDMDSATTDIAILINSTVQVTGGLSIGGNTFTLDIAKKLGVPLEAAHQLKVLNGLSAGPRQAKLTDALKPNLSKIVHETKRIMRYYGDRFPSGEKIEQVLIVGSGSNVPGIGEFFTNELVMPVRTASPWQVLNFGTLAPPAKQVRARFMAAAGLAMVQPEDIWS